MSAGTESVPLVGTPRTEVGEGERLARRTSLRIGIAETVAGGLGAIDVFLLLWLVLPSPAYDGERATVFAINAAVLAVFLTVISVLAWRFGEQRYARSTAWLREGRVPTEEERRGVLCQPILCAMLNAAGWTFGAIGFGLLNLLWGWELALHVSSTIFLGGLTCTALGYLLVERIQRPVTARALAYGPVTRPKGPGVTARLLLAWVSATGVPLLGLILLAVHVLVEPEATLEQVATSVVALSLIAVMAGLLATWLVAKSLSEPLTAMRRALGRIQEGDLRARVTVTDGSEVGLLESGFNAMAAGLAEREQLRDLFGRHVGEDVASKALAGEPRLGGEMREVAVLFVDLIGSTRMAAVRPPREVVTVLNDFFAVVVDVVGRHGGWVNKFEGDAAMCVFGAPADHPDPAGAALAAARELRRRLHPLSRVDAGIGLSAGPAVAGNVGAEHRFEYTVIGDPVNEAARLCELAKRHDRRILASDSIVNRSHNGEGGRWENCQEVTLRGRTKPTRVCAPV